MKKLLLAGIALVALAGGSAFAADLAPVPYYKAPPPPPPVWSWTGFYIGINGGADWFDKSWYVPDTPTNVAGGCVIPGCNFSVGGHSASGGLFGGQVGFNYQISQWVLGVEAQADWTRLEGSNIDPLLAFATDHSKTDSLGTIAGRLGWAWDRALLYGKGGAAWADDTFWTTNPICLPTVCQSTSNTRWGWMVGAGIEYAFAGNWSAKLEYDHLDFGNALETLQPVSAVTVPFQYNIRQTVDIVEAGVNYRFNFGGGPMGGPY
jgi:outer membrane immunogenic protein